MDEAPRCTAAIPCARSRACDLTSDAPLAGAAPARGISPEPVISVDATAGTMTRAEWRRLQAAQAAQNTVEAPAAATALTATSTTAEPTVGPTASEPTTSLAESVIADVAAAATTLRRRNRVAGGGSVSTTQAVAPAGIDPVGEVAPLAQVVSTPATAAIPATFAAAEPCLTDDFERAARALSFTGQMPVQAGFAAASGLRLDDAVAGQRRSAHAVARASRPGARSVLKRVAAASFSLGVMTVVGLLAVGTTTPASAVAAVSNVSADISVVTKTVSVADEDIQAYVTADGSTSTSLDRPEDYDVASMADIAADSGVTIFAGTWVNDPTADIQWPFPVGVPISAAYGSATYLSKFSSPHRGVDLTPGAGAEVHAVAAGTVRIATEAGGEYGVTVVIDHIIDGELVSTRYGHMQYGSLEVAVGDTVEAGQVIGKVGATGKATGPHLHLEVLLGGTTHTDPMAWLEEHTDG